jgi:hypothetical protein
MSTERDGLVTELFKKLGATDGQIEDACTNRKLAAALTNEAGKLVLNGKPPDEDALRAIVPHLLPEKAKDAFFLDPGLRATQSTGSRRARKGHR